MSCPDNLLIGYRRGALSDEEQARLAGHLGGCPTCRLTLRVGIDFEQVLHMQPGDDLIAARFARNLEGKVARLGARPEPSRSRQRSAWIAAVLLALGAGAGLAAARFGAWPFVASSETAVPAERVDGRGGPRERPGRQPVQQPVAVAVEPVVEPQAATAEPARSAAAGAAPSAEALFAQANALRRTGESKRARALYRRLQQLYPRSAQVEVSHVSLGRVQLELGEPRDALAQFERYLSKQPRGALAEEALFGKASALQRLGRRELERQTWQALLAAYPGSVYAERARQRLEPAP